MFVVDFVDLTKFMVNCDFFATLSTMPLTYML